MPFGDGSNLDEKLQHSDAQSGSLSLLSLAKHEQQRQETALLLSSDVPHPGLRSSISNLAGVYAQILPELPSAIATKLKDDTVNHTG